MRNYSAYDLKTFYNGRVGRVVRSVLQDVIEKAWGDLRGLRIMGCGYVTPYLDFSIGQAERVFAVMPAGQGAHVWPSEAKNLACLSEEAELPIETGSVDCVLLVHSLEYSELPRSSLEEIWRVLKSNGRLLAILPNRAGLWSMAGSSPFGHGAPFSRAQTCAALRDSLFTIEQAGHALYVPPFSPFLFHRSARFFERVGPWLYPAFAGLHVIEATKQIYGAMPLRENSAARIRGRTALASSSVSSGGRR